MGSSTLILGIGVNDSDYTVVKYENIEGKRKQVWICPYYLRWTNMIKRCYRQGRATYEECEICEDWFLFSNFKTWMQSKDWEDKHLDKDLLLPGNKLYSPETCVFISGELNSFLLDHKSRRGDLPLGVSKIKGRNKFSSFCRNPFTKKNENLGYFETPEQAHLTWKKRKLEHAKVYADLQSDLRISKALLERYS